MNDVYNRSSSCLGADATTLVVARTALMLTEHHAVLSTDALKKGGFMNTLDEREHEGTPPSLTMPVSPPPTMPFSPSLNVPFSPPLTMLVYPPD